MLAISKTVVNERDSSELIERGEMGVPMHASSEQWTPLGPLTIPQTAVRWYGDEVVASGSLMVLAGYLWVNCRDTVGVTVSAVC